MGKLNAAELVETESGKFIIGIIELPDSQYTISVFRPCGACSGTGCHSCAGQGYTGDPIDPSTEENALTAGVNDYRNRVNLADAIMNGLKADPDLAVFPKIVRCNMAARVARYALGRFWSAATDNLCEYFASWLFAGELEEVKKLESAKKKKDVKKENVKEEGKKNA